MVTMVSGYWQTNSIISLLFLFCSVQFCLSELDFGRNGIVFRDLKRENSLLNRIVRISAQYRRNDPIISNNRYSEYLQTENAKGSNFNEIRYQKIRSLNVDETGLNRINNEVIRVSGNDGKHCLESERNSKTKCTAKYHNEPQREQKKLKERENRGENLRETRLERSESNRISRDSRSINEFQSELLENDLARMTEARNQRMRKIVDYSRNKMRAVERKYDDAHKERAQGNRLTRRNNIQNYLRTDRIEQDDRNSRLNHRQNSFNVERNNVLFSRRIETKNRDMRNYPIFVARKNIRNVNENQNNKILQNRVHKQRNQDQRMLLRNRESRYDTQQQSFEKSLVEKRNYINREPFRNFRSTVDTVEGREIRKHARRLSYREENHLQFPRRENREQRLRDERRLDQIREIQRNNENFEIAKYNRYLKRYQVDSRERDISENREYLRTNSVNGIETLRKERAVSENRLESSRMTNHREQTQKTESEQRQGHDHRMARRQGEFRLERDNQWNREILQERDSNENREIRREHQVRDTHHERDDRREYNILNRNSPSRYTNRQENEATKLREIINGNKREEYQELSKNNENSRNERLDINSCNYNEIKNSYFSNQKSIPLQNVMFDLIQGLLIGAIALNAFSVQNSKKLFGMETDSIISLKCF